MANATELDSKCLTAKRMAVYKLPVIPSIFHPEFLRIPHTKTHLDDRSIIDDLLYLFPLFIVTVITRSVSFDFQFPASVFLEEENIRSKRTSAHVLRHEEAP